MNSRRLYVAMSLFWVIPCFSDGFSFLIERGRDTEFMCCSGLIHFDGQRTESLELRTWERQGGNTHETFAILFAADIETGKLGEDVREFCEKLKFAVEDGVSIKKGQLADWSFVSNLFVSVEWDSRGVRKSFACRKSDKVPCSFVRCLELAEAMMRTGKNESQTDLNVFFMEGTRRIDDIPYRVSYEDCKFSPLAFLNQRICLEGVSVLDDGRLKTRRKSQDAFSAAMLCVAPDVYVGEKVWKSVQNKDFANIEGNLDFLWGCLVLPDFPLTTADLRLTSAQVCREELVDKIKPSIGEWPRTVYSSPCGEFILRMKGKNGIEYIIGFCSGNLRCVKRLSAETSSEEKYRVFLPIAILNVNRSDNKHLEELEACLTRVNLLLNKVGKRNNTPRILCEAEPFSQIKRFVCAEANSTKLYEAVTNLFELVEQYECKKNKESSTECNVKGDY